MKILSLSFLILSSFQIAHCQDFKTLIAKAEKNYTDKNYRESSLSYKRAFAAQPAAWSDYYNAACSAALSDNAKQALDWLGTAIEKGYTNIRHMKSDSDLTSLYKTDEWQALTKKLQEKVDKIEANYDKKLQTRLLTIFDEDQTYRKQLGEMGQKFGFESKEVQALWKTIEVKDSLNLIEVKSILDQYGWVGEDKVGGQANSALFLVIQHADLATQQRYLPVMREAVKLGKAEPSALALLEDRVALGEGRRQTYGSQIGEDSTGKAYVMALDDPDNVDKRREGVGLNPLADYVRGWGILWDVAAYKKQLPEIERRNNIK